MMCELILREITVRDAVIEALHQMRTTEGGGIPSITLVDCPRSALERIISVHVQDGETDVAALLRAAIESLEDFEDNFEPDYIANEDDPRAHRCALYELRLQLGELVNQ